MDVPRMRTIRQCADYFKAMDSDTAIAHYRIRQDVIQGKIKVCKAGKKNLINLDMLIGYYYGDMTEDVL